MPWALKKLTYLCLRVKNLYGTNKKTDRQTWHAVPAMRPRRTTV